MASKTAFDASATPSKRLTPNPSVREQIAAGPRFERDVSTDEEERAGCVCGLRSQSRDGHTYRDRLTRLCVDCWRAWRWSSVRERLNPAASD